MTIRPYVKRDGARLGMLLAGALPHRNYPGLSATLLRAAIRWWVNKDENRANDRSYVDGANGWFLQPLYITPHIEFERQRAKQRRELALSPHKWRRVRYYKIDANPLPWILYDYGIQPFCPACSAPCHPPADFKSVNYCRKHRLGISSRARTYGAEIAEIAMLRDAIDAQRKELAQ